MSVHKELKRYREEVLGISQDEAIKRLHMTQAALSNYEHGKRQISIETLQQFQRAYAIPQDHLMRILFGEDTGKEYSAMMLREHSRDSELHRILEMIENNESLYKFLISLSHSNEKIQRDVSTFLPHILKLVHR
ncbi:helix-turn-helix transcriptional regulator [Lederbergia sp. NSJ-179]|uniref:helix-turn-helix domain-containing protein n=1 Tax=Lederbergia sp. NSJ-179 TaxID=2931402 RepID=UPI001FD43A1B|nr:helix-turn-helix transcriptional regulator [Lederbergia sp. NSJ-179]MCJ7840622.1 helix-turn-helix transcriptional regulator [Lederbergia sp. NSJ-179]